MSFYKYLNLFNSEPEETLDDFMSSMAEGKFLNLKKEEILSRLVKITAIPNALKVTFDRSAVKVKTIEDLFDSATVERLDPITGSTVPHVHRKTVVVSNTYHDYHFAIGAFLEKAKREKVIDPYRELVTAYRTSLTKETLFHYCYFYDIVSKVPLEILETIPEILCNYMLILNTFLAAGKVREAALVKETILYLVTSSKVMRTHKDKMGNNALYYCSSLDVAARYLTVEPEALDNVNKFGINTLLSSFASRDLKLLYINVHPGLIWATIKVENEGANAPLDSPFGGAKEYLFFSITDSFILKFIVDMVLKNDPEFFLNTENGGCSIWNTSKCFDVLLYLNSQVKPETMAPFVRDHKECYQVLFSNKIKLLSTGGSKMELVSFENFRDNEAFIQLEKLFEEYRTTELY